MNLTDKVAVVTGASAGLGAFFSEALVGKGATVFGLARREEKLQNVRDRIGDRFHPIVCDVRDEDSINAAFEQILDASDGQLDVLINNAGLGQYAPVTELTTEQWDVQMETNLRGVFLCTRAAVPAMRTQNEASGFGGHIVNIASIAGLLGNPRLGGYNASKFGVRGFSEAIMKELRSDGIKVTCVYPGSIDTSFGDISGGSGGGTTHPMQAEDITSTVIHILETPENYLISEIVMRPLRPRG